MTAPVAWRLDVPGGPLDARRWGDPPGDGPAVVLLHEGLGSADLWRGFPAALHEATGVPVVAWSRHGHGRSAPLPAPRDPGYLHHEADVVLPAVLDSLGVGRPVLVGHSDGGSIALLWAGSPAGAGRVAGLALLAPHVIVEDLSVASIAAVAAGYRPGGLAGRMARHHDDADALFAAWSGIWLDPAFRSFDARDRLGAVTCPVLLVQGDADRYGTLRQLDEIEAGVAGPVERLVLAGVDHAPHLEAPGATLAAVAALVGRAGSPGQDQGRAH